MHYEIKETGKHGNRVAVVEEVTGRVMAEFSGCDRYTLARRWISQR